MEQISSQKDKVHLNAISASALETNVQPPYIVLHGELEDLFEGLNGILSTYGIPFQVAYMIVCGQHDLYGVVRVYRCATKSVSATSPPLATCATLTGVANCRRGDPLELVFGLVTHCVMR